MIDMFREISEACALGIPSQHHKVVGVIGAGGIVSGAHLPAYKKAGLAVHAITDIDDAKATAVAKDFDIPHVYSSAEELLQDDAIEVVDIAVPASWQRCRQENTYLRKNRLRRPLRLPRRWRPPRRLRGSR